MHCSAAKDGGKWPSVETGVIQGSGKGTGLRVKSLRFVLMTTAVAAVTAGVGLASGPARAFQSVVAEPAPAADRPMIGPEPDGRLVYVPDSRGDRVPDFSHAGYAGGGVALPMPAATVVVEAPRGDATAAVQAAIDRVSALAPGADGVRGVVRLSVGRFEIGGQLKIRTGGVILRGSGAGESGTVLVATGVDRRALIDVRGRAAPEAEASSRRAVTDAYVPVGGLRLTLASVDGLKVGDEIEIGRPSTTEWIARLGMNLFEGWRPQNRLHWQAGSRDLAWTRRVTAIDGAVVTLDAPVTTSLDARYGGGWVAASNGEGRLAQVGIENLRLVSPHDPARPKDEDHAWFGVTMDHLRDGWIRDVSARGFVSYVVNLGPDASRITVQDVEAAGPVSEIGGFRRRVFYAAGQQVLFNRCASRNGSHDFVLGHAAAGPNVFLDCTATDANDDSGPIESWASGALFDNVVVRGGPLRLADRRRDGQGAGWTAANSVLWNCEATDVEAAMPPDAFNLAIGCKGVVRGDGVVERPGVEAFRDFERAVAAQPRSLYLAQLGERLGAGAETALARAVYPAADAATPRLTTAEVRDWQAAHAAPAPAHGPLTIAGGRFVIDGQDAWRRKVGFSWFQGQMPPSLARASGPAITRFAPGRDGVGATDDLAETVANLRAGDVFYHHYGLWYDRRRVDHNYFGSPDERSGEVWGPFMELPWRRSGAGRAWDGLSKYDLTQFNPWFFDRVDGFAAEADRQGRVLFYSFYFQHWLLESRAHYVDFPWRPVNAIQPTGLPNEVPAAEVFYDVSDPVRRDLHRRYIRHSLDVLKDRTNVVFGIDREYTGPLGFVEFWLDTIAEWERENRRDVKVVLEIPKAQLDALLADPVRRPLFDAMAVHNWLYRNDGRLFAVVGGINKAPREQQDAFIPPPNGNEALGVQRAPLWETTPAMKYRAWREYADKAPDLVFLFPQDLFPDLTRAVEAAVPAADRRGAVMSTEAVTGDGAPSTTAWSMTTPAGARLVYSTDGAAVRLALTGAGSLSVRWIGEGAPGGAGPAQAESGVLTLNPPESLAGRPWAAWVWPAAGEGGFQ
jgi:hypothetical protein